MKRISKLFDQIRNLDDIDLYRIERGRLEDYEEIFLTFEQILKEFYMKGYEHGLGEEHYEDVDFQNCLSNFYQFDEA